MDIIRADGSKHCSRPGKVGMRIGIDGRFLTHPQRGGFKTYTKAIIDSLALTDTHNEYIIYTDRPSSEGEKLPGNFTVKEVQSPHAIIREQITLPAVMRRDNIDLAHFPCNTAPFMRPPRMVVTIHDVIPLKSNGKKMSPKQRLLNYYWRTTIPKCARVANIVVTSSEFAQDDLCKTLDISPNKVRIVPIAIDSVYFGDNPGTPPEDVTSSTRFIMAFAAADGRKNHWAAIEAYRAISAEIPELMMVLVCSHPTIRNLISNSGFSGVIPVGPVSADELLWLYRNGSALIFPSREEGFGLPPIEAMACGMPAVVSNSSSLPEVLGPHAVYIDPTDTAGIADATSLILQDQEYRNRLINGSRKYVSRFSREYMARTLSDVYSETAVQLPRAA